MYSSVLTVLSSLSNSCTSIILIKAISITTVTREMCPAEKIIMFIPSLAPYQMFPPPTLHNQTKSPVPSQYPWRHYSHHLSLSPHSDPSLSSQMWHLVTVLQSQWFFVMTGPNTISSKLQWEVQWEEVRHSWEFIVFPSHNSRHMTNPWRWLTDHWAGYSPPLQTIVTTLQPSVTSECQQLPSVARTDFRPTEKQDQKFNGFNDLLELLFATKKWLIKVNFLLLIPLEQWWRYTLIRPYSGLPYLQNTGWRWEQRKIAIISSLQFMTDSSRLENKPDLSLIGSLQITWPGRGQWLVGVNQDLRFDKILYFLWESCQCKSPKKNFQSRTNSSLWARVLSVIHWNSFETIKIKFWTDCCIANTSRDTYSPASVKTCPCGDTISLIWIYSLSFPLISSNLRMHYTQVVSLKCLVWPTENVRFRLKSF